MLTAYEAKKIKEEICDIGRRVYDRGFVAANDGNISVRVGPNEFFTTPTGVSKGYMTPDMICHVDGEGKLLEPCCGGKYKPSSEFKMHLRVYRERPDVNAVVHAHPPIATAFTVANIPMDQYILPEAILTIGDVPTCEYGTPSTEEIPDSIEPYLQQHDAFLLKNHGALTVGNTLLKACFTMEEVEFNARICYYARQLGGVDEIPCDQLEKLMELRKKFNLPGKHPGCKKCKNLGTENCRCKGNLPATGAAPAQTAGKSADEDIVALVTRQVLAALGK